MEQAKSAEMGVSWGEEGFGPHKPIIHSRTTVESFPSAKKKRAAKQKAQGAFLRQISQVSESVYFCA